MVSLIFPALKITIQKNQQYVQPKKNVVHLDQFLIPAVTVNSSSLQLSCGRVLAHLGGILMIFFSIYFTSLLRSHGSIFCQRLTGENIVSLINHFLNSCHIRYRQGSYFRQQQ